MTQQQTQSGDVWGSPPPKQPVGNTVWGSPAPYDEPDDDSVETLPTLESLTQEVRRLASLHVDFEKQVDDMVRDFHLDSHVGAGATEAMRHEVWQTQLQQLDKREGALIANVRSQERRLQALHASIDVLDAAEDVPTSVYSEAASVLTFVASQVDRMKRGDTLAAQLQAIASRGDSA